MPSCWWSMARLHSAWVCVDVLPFQRQQHWLLHSRSCSHLWHQRLHAALLYCTLDASLLGLCQLDRHVMPLLQQVSKPGIDCTWLNRAKAVVIGLARFQGTRVTVCQQSMCASKLLNISACQSLLHPRRIRRRRPLRGCD